MRDITEITLCITLAALVVNMMIWTISDWRYSKIIRLRKQLEYERIKNAFDPVDVKRSVIMHNPDK